MIRFALPLFLAVLLAPAASAQPTQEKPEKLPLPAEMTPPAVPTSPALPLPLEAYSHDVGPHCAPPIVEKTVPYPQVLLVPTERATTMPDWKLRECEIGRFQPPVLDFHEEKQCVTELELREHEVAEQVVVQESKPVTVIDPCTGCPHTEYEMCPVVKIVKIKVYETVPVQRLVIVRTPILKPGPPMIAQKLILHETTVPAIERTFQAVITPNEIHVVTPAPTCLLPVHP